MVKTFIANVVLGNFNVTLNLLYNNKINTCEGSKIYGASFQFGLQKNN